MESFLNGIGILGRGFEDHTKIMEQVLSQFRDLKLKTSKCELLNRYIILIQERLRK